MEFLINFYIFLFYFTLTIICYYILGFFNPNNSNSIFSYIGLGDNFILASIIIIIIYFCFRVYIDNEMVGIPKLKYSEFKKNAKTGDLIIYRWEYVDVGFRMFSKYCHVAMVVKKGKKFYLLETHPNENKNNIGKKDNQGVHLYVLKNRLSQYNGQYYLVPLNSNINRDKLTKNILDDIKTFKKEIPFDNAFRDLFVYNYFANKLGIKLTEKKEMFCSEFIGYILNKYNIYKHNGNLTSIEPGTFLSFKNNTNDNLFRNLKEICFT